MVDGKNTESGAIRVFQLVNYGLPSCEMVHDECATFEQAYTHVFGLMRRARPDGVEFPDGRTHSLGFDRLRSLCFGPVSHRAVASRRRRVGGRVRRIRPHSKPWRNSVAGAQSLRGLFPRSDQPRRRGTRGWRILSVPQLAGVPAFPTRGPARCSPSPSTGPPKSAAGSAHDESVGYRSKYGSRSASAQSLNHFGTTTTLPALTKSAQRNVQNRRWVMASVEPRCRMTSRFSGVSRSH